MICWYILLIYSPIIWLTTHPLILLFDWLLNPLLMGCSLLIDCSILFIGCSWLTASSFWLPTPSWFTAPSSWLLYFISLLRSLDLLLLIDCSILLIDCFHLIGWFILLISCSWLTAPSLKFVALETETALTVCCQLISFN